MRTYTLTMRTRKPSLRITRWLRRIGSPEPRIPFEAECSACADAQFKIKHDKRWEERRPKTHLPWGDPNRYVNLLQLEFEEHMKLVHPEEYERIRKQEIQARIIELEHGLARQRPGKSKAKKRQR